MATLAGSIVQDTKLLLNDTIGAIYPDTVILPLLQKAYKELQVRLTALGISTTREISTITTVVAGIKSLGDGSGLPQDFLSPIEIRERAVGSTETFQDMFETEWEVDMKPSTSLTYWTYREEVLYFPGATQDRQLLIRYIKALVPIIDTNTPIMINNAELWLAQRTAAIAALVIGSNPSRSAALMQDLNAQNGPWEDFKATKVKPTQNLPVRRRRTRYHRY